MRKKIATILLLTFFLFSSCALAGNNDYKDKIQKISDEIRNAKLNNMTVEYPRLYLERGEYYSQIDEDDNAMMDFNRVIQMDNVPIFWLGAAYYGRAYIYNKHFEYDKVILNLNGLSLFSVGKALEAHPKIL